MSKVQSNILQKVGLFITDHSGSLLSELLGTETRFALQLENTYMLEEDIEKNYLYPCVCLKIDWGKMGNFCFLIGESMFLDLVNIMAGKWCMSKEIDKEIYSITQEKCDWFFSKLSDVMTEELGEKVSFGSTHIDVVRSAEEIKELISYKWFNIRFTIANGFTTRIVNLMSPSITDGYMAMSSQAREVIGAKAYEFRSGRINFAPACTEKNRLRKDRKANNIMDVELPIAVELGRICLPVKDIIDLEPGAVVKLKRFSDAPVDLYVNNRKFAEGEVVIVDENYRVRITTLTGLDKKFFCFQ